MLANPEMKRIIREIGFPIVYLTTDHNGYYERYGWIRIEDGIDLISCKPTRIYKKML